MSDRSTQDDVIRALADASFRSSEPWLKRNLADPQAVERFARFLARHFYYERIVHFFKYSSTLSGLTGRLPESALVQDQFNALLPELVLGSRQTARQVADLVSDYIRSSRGATQIPYLEDLLAYESAMMIAEAGPRVWRDDDGPPGRQDPGPDEIARLGQNIQLLQLHFDVTAVLPALLDPKNIPSSAPAGPIRLMFSRSPHGRVIVAHSTPTMETLLRLADENSTFQHILEASGLQESELEETLRDLQEWGALHFSIGS